MMLRIGKYQYGMWSGDGVWMCGEDVCGDGVIWVKGEKNVCV